MPCLENFEVINHVHPDEKFDKFKDAIAVEHPELLKEFLDKYSDRFIDKSIKSWRLEECSDPYKYELACDVLGISYSDQIQKLFVSSFKEWYEMGHRKNMVIYALKYNIDVSNPKIIKRAIKRNDLSVVAALVRAGADPNSVHNWTKKVSPEMYKVIMSNL